MNFIMLSEFYIVLFARPEKGTYHWSTYNLTKNKLYHITNRTGSWKYEIKSNYIAWKSLSAVTAIKLGTIDDNYFDNVFQNEQIKNDDTCRTFIMRVNNKVFNINLEKWENICNLKANENARNVEAGKGITIHNS